MSNTQQKLAQLGTVSPTEVFTPSVYITDNDTPGASIKVQNARYPISLAACILIAQNHELFVDACLRAKAMLSDSKAIAAARDAKKAKGKGGSKSDALADKLNQL